MLLQVKKIRNTVCVLLAILISAMAFTLNIAAKGEYKSWKQSDDRWGSISFGQVGDTMSSSGCAVTSIAMLMVHCGAVPDDESSFNPGILVNFLNKNNGFTYDGGIYWASPSKYASSFGFVKSMSISGSVSEKTSVIKEYLDGGYVLVAMVKNGGHFVAVDRVSDSVVYIMDPARNGYDRLFGYDASGVTRLIVYKGPHGVPSPAPDPTPDPAPDPETPVENPLGAEKSSAGYYTGTYTVTSDNGINVRKGPSSNYDKFPYGVDYGTSVTVTKVEGNWGRIIHDSEEGWICLDYARRTSPIITGIKVTPPDKLSYIPGEALNLDGMKAYALYDNGTSCRFTGYTVDDPQFTNGKNTITVRYFSLSASFEITYNGTQPTDEPVENPLGAEKSSAGYYTGTYTVTSDNGINVRKGPSSNYDKFPYGVDYGTSVTVTRVEGNWGRITHDSEEGWICLDYARRTSPIITGIKVTPPDKLSYIPGEALNLDGMKAYALYDNGTSCRFTGYTVDAHSFTDGKNTVTVSYYELSTSFEITYVSVRPMGDVNGDYRVNANDALLTLQFSVGKLDGAAIDTGFADVNSSGSIDATDALLILQCAVGKISGF